MERGLAPLENIFEIADILPRDPIAARGLGHGGLQRNGRGLGDIVSLRPSEAGRRSACDGAEGKLGVLEHRATPSTCASAARRSLGLTSAAAASGAQSRMMPRLVLVPTAASVASTASRMRLPTRAPGRRSGAAAASALRTNSAAVMRWPGGEDMDVAGLRRLELVKTSRDEGGGNLLRQLVTPSLRAPSAPAERGDKVAGELRRNARRA